MEYNREYWQPRIATKPNRFRKLNESTDYVELINEPEAITQEGTAFTAARLNNIEAGITGAVAGVNNMEAGIEGAVAGVNEIQGVLDFTEAVVPFSGLSQTPRLWRGMTTLGSDVYACVFNGDIYKQTGGVGDFVALGQETRSWLGMTTLGNDVYACVNNGDIYKQTNGIGDFIALGQESRGWYGMTTLGSDVYACGNGGDIYKQTNGTGDFVALGQESRGWRGMTTLGNDVYACVYNGDIYKQTGGVGDFVALGQETRNWLGMTTLGDVVYACVYNGDIYKQTGGVGDFVALGQETRLWRGMTTLGDVVYACVYGGDIYTATFLTGNTYRASTSFTLPAMPDGARKRILNTHATTAITVTAYSGTTIEGKATMTLSAGHKVELELIGTDWRKVVLSQSATPEAGKAMVWPDPPILDADLLGGLESTRFAEATRLIMTGNVIATMTKSGMYVSVGGTNAPGSGTYCYFTNYFDYKTAAIIAIQVQTGAIFINRKIGGTWAGWSGLETDKIPFATKTGTSTGTQGQASFDASYLYLCTATNVWKRVALTEF